MDLDAQYRSIQEEIDQTIFRVIHSYQFINGPEVKLFEQNFAKAQEVQYCLGLASGTAALHLAYEVLGLGVGDEVLVPSMTFIATAEPLRQIGAVPVFVDIDPQSFNLSINDLEKRITDKTKAIVAVHLHGNPCDMEAIMEIARKYKLKVIEDCAQSHLAEYKGKKVGNFGNIATFSFYPGKNLGAYGDAGALVTNNKDYFEKAALLYNHGRKEKYFHETEGYNYRLDTLQAAVLDVKLKHLAEWTDKRIEVALYYTERLKNLPLILPEISSDKKHVFHIFAIASNKREIIINKLRDNNIAYGIHYPLPLHLQKAYKGLGYKQGDLPVSERLSQQFISLPMYSELSFKAVDKVCDIIESCLI